MFCSCTTMSMCICALYCSILFIFDLAVNDTPWKCTHLFPMGSFGFAEETAIGRDSIGIQGIRVRYSSSLRIDPLVILRAHVLPIHARITWVLYQCISILVGNTWNISEIPSAPAGNWTGNLWNGRPECYHSITAPPYIICAVAVSLFSMGTNVVYWIESNDNEMKLIL